MDSSYYKNAKNCVVSALRGNQCTFEELCRKCHGLYPTVVRDIISEMKIYSTLIPTYTTDQNRIPLEQSTARPSRKVRMPNTMRGIGKSKYSVSP